MLAFNLALLVFLCISGLVVAAETGESAAAGLKLASVFSALLLSGTGLAGGDDNDDDDEGKGKREQNPHRERTRRFVNQIFQELGPYCLRRAYRMDAASFWELHRILKPYIESKKKQTHHKKGAKNGLISTEIRLSSGIRYFAGGRPDDICLVHGISHSEVFNSVWKVLDAVNKCPLLDICYPTDHNTQRKIAADFKRRSQAGFDCCAGAIDGMLVWTEKPTEASCKRADCGVKKFFCGRKKKFGVSLQGVCDAECRFLDISIGHPGSTSDYLAFRTSSLCHKLETEGFLADDVCLFGDNAYVTNGYMSTPYKNIRSGNRDDYNFYHSQLRIKIECTFGMLVNRWGILRRPIPASLGIYKTNGLVMCLARLHNYCINRRLKDIPALAKDSVEISSRGGIPLEQSTLNQMSPDQLLHGGEHFDEWDTEGLRGELRAIEKRARRRRGGKLLRDEMLEIVIEKEMRRPRPKAWDD